ncbi:hypothetical protein [Rickettsia amblyommatis]|uniref:hypothetical protein n=1 Tax=Rickettsia amblyommatis TaxID=33989 RepID=UPI00117E0218|nr:hypothetical protein [Rickettsia amblyommatis]
MSIIPNSALPAWIPSRHCERLQGAWQSSKNNKNLNLAFLTGLLRQNLQFFLAMTGAFKDIYSY